jgi:hypothetical protein
MIFGEGLAPIANNMTIPIACDYNVTRLAEAGSITFYH